MADPGQHRTFGRRLIAFLVSMIVPGTGHFVWSRWGRGVIWFILTLLALVSVPVTGAYGLGVFIFIRLPAALDATLVRRTRILYPTWRQVLLGWGVLFAIAFGFLFLVRDVYVEQYEIPSESMMPTVLPGDVVVVSKAIFKLRLPFTSITLAHPAAPIAGDLILFRDQEKKVELIKRVVAVAGDTVGIHEGLVTVNGIAARQGQRRSETFEGVELSLATEVLGDERYGVATDPKAGPVELPDVTVPEGSVFVLGDNRTNSRDSRHFGPVPIDSVDGKVLFVMWSEGGDGPRWTRLGKSLR